MLSLYVPLVYPMLVSYGLIASLLILLLNQTQYTFFKVWLVFAYLSLQAVLLGYYGEDFFVIVIVSAEVPVFFAFFFFCVVKTQLGAIEGGVRAGTGKGAYAVPTIAGIAIWVYPRELCGQSFHHYLVDQLVSTTQRSDFFVFYFSFFVAASQFILFIGLLITMLTLVILFFTFKNQLVSVAELNKANSIAWVRVQDTALQNSQRRSFMFFEL